MLYSISKYPLVSYDHIKTLISDYDIYDFYLGSHYKIGKAYKSPLRVDDNNPSFGLFESGDGKLLFKDQGSAITGNSIYFVQIYLGLSSFEAALCRVIVDLIIGRKIQPIKNIDDTIKTTYRKVELKVKRQPFSDIDLSYWKSFNISKEILEFF